MKKLNQLLLFSCIGVGFALLKGIEAEAIQPQLMVDGVTQQSANMMSAESTPVTTKKKKKTKKNKKKSKKSSAQNVNSGNVQLRPQQKSAGTSKASKPNLNNPNEALGYRIERLRLITKSLKKAYTTWMQSGARNNTPQYDAVDQLIKGKLINRIKKLQTSYNEWLKFNGSSSPSQRGPSSDKQPVEDDWKNEVPAESPMASLEEAHKTFILADKSEAKEPVDTTLYRLSKENLENLHKELEKYRTTNDSKSTKA